MTRLLPGSLFGRTLLVLAAGLLLAQAASVVINLLDRGGSVYRLAATQIASRVAQNARILNALRPEERWKVVQAVDGPHLRITLSDRPVPVAGGFKEHDRYEAAFMELLRRQVDPAWRISVEITSSPRPRDRSASEPQTGEFEAWIARNFYYLLPDAFAIVAQVGLDDGAVAVFSAVVPQEPLRRLESLIPQLLLMVVLCFALAGVFEYMVTRSLDRLASAADAVGDSLDGPDLEESGPSEVQRVIGAFNRMRRRLRDHLQDRTRLLGAISHDLKTPLTRLRLRTEMIGDAEAAARMQRDLDEMEAMVRSTLEFFRGLDAEPQRRAIDMPAMIESLVEDRREVGQDVSVATGACAPYHGHPLALRRCLDNLMENAVRYGRTAQVTVIDGVDALRIEVRDRGPGIPEAELQRVFEPYYRLEGSRNLGSGGIGLGLSIARNIARWHGGDIELRNAPSGGLSATLVLPRVDAVKAPGPVARKSLQSAP